MSTMREVMLRMAAAFVLCLSWSCGPPPRVSASLASDIPPIVGTVDLGALYSVAATLGDIGNGATVSLIDTVTNVSMSSTISTPSGGFTLSFPSTFAPTINPYYLEAVKGLAQNRPGNSAARLRTIIKFNQGWTYLTVGALNVGKASTAIAIIAGHRSGLPEQVDYSTLIDALDVGGSPPAFRPGTSGISQADYTTVFGYVDKALIADRDPLAAITYNATTKSYTYTDTTSPQVLLMNPTVITAGSTVNLTGQNYTTTLAGNTVSFAGTNGTVTAATTTQLTVVAPPGVVPGVLTVTTAVGVSNGVPYTVIKGVNGSLIP